MKSTKKIIIGVIAVIALLITIAGALAAAPPTATYIVNAPNTDQSSTTVTLNKTQQATFNIAVANNPELKLTYQWLVNGLPAKPSETQPDPGSYTSSFLFDATTKTVGPYIVSVVVTGNGGNPDLSLAWTVTVQDPQPTTLLTISNIKVNGKTSGKLKPGEINEVEVEITNDNIKKATGIVVDVDLLDEDKDSVTDESYDDDGEFDLSAGKSKTVTLELDLRNEDLDQSDYTLQVDVEGDIVDGPSQKDSETKTVDVDREKDAITITKTDLEDSQVFCSASGIAQDSLKVRIKNIGENDQNNARITVKNNELNLNQERTGIDLDDYSGPDNEDDVSFNLNLEDAAQGTYQLDVSVYTEDDDLMDSKEVELQVVCANAAEKPTETKGTSSGNTQQYADKELAAELQQQIDQYKAAQEQAQSTQQNSFRGSDSYLLMLGILVALMFFAAVLSATYMLVKKR